MREEEKRAVLGLGVPLVFLVFALAVNTLATLSVFVGISLFIKVGLPEIQAWRKQAKVKGVG